MAAGHTILVEKEAPFGRPPVRVRFRWRVSGQVQGVGFRPFVYRLASELNLTGWVRNGADGVWIEAQGETEQLCRFEQGLRDQCPALAVISDLRRERAAPVPDESGFVIGTSTCTTPPTAAITPDAAICPACLADVRNPADFRRFGYALTNCTACGPRYSIVRGIPYDRANTTMAAFALCPACQHEYGNPLDRRFHAQPTACHACGPRLERVDPTGAPLPGDPIRETARDLLAGRIIAIKGIGGYHLALRADDAAAVARLRALKHRPAKPLALMVATMEQAERLVVLSDPARRELAGPRAPVVLGSRRAEAAVAPGVAPGSHRLGVMLAYTPLHHLLFDAMGADAPPLVMTSANDGDRPILYRDADAIAELGCLCDAILRHDRPIQRPVDDSVLVDTGDEPILIRRARGYVPAAIALGGGDGASAGQRANSSAGGEEPRPALAEAAEALPGPALKACAQRTTLNTSRLRTMHDGSPGLALGAELKNTVGVLRGGEAILSQHLGDLTHTATYRQFIRAIDDLLRLFEVQPAWVAHDLHPMYLSTRHARALAERWQVPLIAVQHHHAHAAAVLAEHGMAGRALAIVCDGTGYGPDGTIWGGELLLVDAAQFRRLAHLRPLRLPGGDAAARQPWRSALALLFNVYGEGFADHPAAYLLADQPLRRFVAEMIRANTGCVASSSTGRVFDAVAALLGLCRENRFDAEAPMALESAAAEAAGDWEREKEIAAGIAVAEAAGADDQLDVSPLIRQLLAERQRGTPVPLLAALFHEALAAIWALAAERAARSTGVTQVVLSGGSMCNARLVAALCRRLERAGMRVLMPRLAPPNDGGIALGQLAVAAARLHAA